MKPEYLIPENSPLYPRVDKIFHRLNAIYVGSEYNSDFTPLELTFANGLSTPVNLYESKDGVRQFQLWYPSEFGSSEHIKDVFRGLFHRQRWSMGFTPISYSLVIAKNFSTLDIFGNIIETNEFDQDRRVERPLGNKSFPSGRLLEITEARLVDIPAKIEYREDF